MSDTMRAAVFYGPGSPLRVERVPRPTPATGEALVQIAGCGFCHTDLHYLDHGVPTAKAPPLILGHEISGRVQEAGPGVPLTRGQPVLVPAVLPCQSCVLCRTGRENICQQMRMFGNHLDGGFAEFVVAPAKDLVPLPADLDLPKAAIIADAVTTAFHAVVNRAQVRAGEWVLVVGCGGVGSSIVQLSVASGARVIAADLRPEKLDAARRLGAEEAVAAFNGEEAVKQVRQLTGGGVHVAFEAVGNPSATTLVLAALRRGGRACLVGYNQKAVEVATSRLMFFEQTVLGSLGCRPADYPLVVDLVRRGRVALDPLVSGRVPLASINDAADRVRQGSGMRTIVVP